MKKSERWNKRQLEHYGPAVEGRTDPPRYRKFIEQYLPRPPLRIIDCGCAGGDVTMDIKKRGYDVIGLDYPEVIAKTKKKYPDLNLIACDLNEGIPSSICDIDWVYASEILEHVTHDFEFLASCYDCLKQGGNVYVTAPRQAEKWGAHLHFYPEMSLKNLVWAAGFEIFAVDKTFASTIVIGEKVIEE